MRAIGTRQLARVAVDDEMWRQFRMAALMRGVSIAAYLGQLVTRELQRRADRLVADASPDHAPSDQALVALTDVRAAIDELDQIAGRLARSAVAHGASWGDVASSLRLSADDARRAYGNEK